MISTGQHLVAKERAKDDREIELSVEEDSPAKATKTAAEGEDDIYDAERHEKVKDKLVVSYPGLSMPNKVTKDEGEIDLDLDELDDAINQKVKEPANII